MTLVKVMWEAFRVVTAAPAIAAFVVVVVISRSSSGRQIITGFSGLEQIFEDDEKEEVEIEKEIKHENLVQQPKVSIIIIKIFRNSVFFRTADAAPLKPEFMTEQLRYRNYFGIPVETGISLLCGTTESIRTCTSTSNEIAVASSLATIN
ncbi:unnamed protein product [Brugia pahangi]|uniref:Secreted protein n=1 Tax=Brugia pahangi TaxID=6280 RepID=A0A0N4TIL9_BRUPA|nr:unnamed protein product [Brugia pahangi]